jgi:WD40 repeat protein
VLRGHEPERTVAYVAWSPAGDRLASASNDGTVRVWDTSGRGELLVLRGHDRSVAHVAWSPVSDRLASASWDGTVRVWHASGQSEPLLLRGHKRMVRRVAWSPAGVRLASAAGDGTVRVWDASGQGEPLMLRGHEKAVVHLAWSPVGDRLASASEDGEVRVWDAIEGTELVRRKLHDAETLEDIVGASPRVPVLRYICRPLPHETRVERAVDEQPVAWFEASGHQEFVPHPLGRPVWAAPSWRSVMLFQLEGLKDSH